MPARLLSPLDLGPEQFAAWRRLSERAVEPNPFHEPDFVLPSMAALDATDVRLLVADTADGEWLACLPVRRGRRWRRVPLPSWSAWVHSYCFLGTPLVDREHVEQGATALLEGAREQPGALLGISLISEGPVLEAIRAAAAGLGRGAITYEMTERAALRRNPDGDYLAINRKHEREISRMRRRLGEELGEELRMVERAGEADAVEEFLRLEQGGWKGKEGTAFASIPGHAQLFRRVCDTFAAGGRLRLLSLQAGSRTVAMKCNLLAGSEVFCFKIAFDEDYARFSPGLQLEVDNADAFHQADRYDLMDSCALPDNQMINRLWAGRRAIGAVAVPLAGPAGAVAPAAVRAGAAMRRKER